MQMVFNWPNCITNRMTLHAGTIMQTSSLCSELFNLYDLVMMLDDF
jgi:hypothetical protein